MVNDAIDLGEVGEEGDDLHQGGAVRAEQAVNLINLKNHLRSAFGRERLELFLHHPEREGLKTCLLENPDQRN